MAVIRCPQCTLPMTEAEAGAGMCPVCGAQLQVPQAAAPVVQAAVPRVQEKAPPMVLLWSFLGGVLLISAAGMWFFSASGKPKDEPQVAEVNSYPPVPAPEVKAPEVTAPEVKTPEPEVEEQPAPTATPALKETPKEARGKSTVELPQNAPKIAGFLPAPRRAPKIAPILPAPPRVAKVDPPPQRRPAGGLGGMAGAIQNLEKLMQQRALQLEQLPLLPGEIPNLPNMPKIPNVPNGGKVPRINPFFPIPLGGFNNGAFKRLNNEGFGGGDRDAEINQPNGTVTVRPINGGKTVKVTGVVKTLKVMAIDNMSILDASGLTAKEIIVVGGINEGSTVKLNAPDGTITFQGQINNGSVVLVTAPNGKVIFEDPNNNINSDSLITITASDVEFRGQINGDGTQINVTLTRDGHLKFREINGAARLHYKNADARFPDPRIEAGTVRPTAELKKLTP